MLALWPLWKNCASIVDVLRETQRPLDYPQASTVFRQPGAASFPQVFQSVTSYSFGELEDTPGNPFHAIGHHGVTKLPEPLCAAA
jgi:hypothetical protein